jgi:mannose-6-phosphate isomerase-like protein (cupin superfamily)
MATVTINNVWEKAKFDKPRQMILLAEQPDDIRIALNCYQPGANNELHYHVGTGQTFLVLRGPCIVRYKAKEEGEEAAPHEATLKEGDSILIPPDVYYQMYNPGPGEVLLYQAKQPGEAEIVVHGKGKLNNREYFTQERTAERAL